MHVIDISVSMRNKNTSFLSSATHGLSSFRANTGLLQALRLLSISPKLAHLDSCGYKQTKLRDCFNNLYILLLDEEKLDLNLITDQDEKLTSISLGYGENTRKNSGWLHTAYLTL